MQVCMLAGMEQKTQIFILSQKEMHLKDLFEKKTYIYYFHPFRFITYDTY